MRARESERDQGVAQNEQRPWNASELGQEGPGPAQNEQEAGHAHQGQAQQVSQRPERLEALPQAQELEGQQDALQEEPAQERQQAQVQG